MFGYLCDQYWLGCFQETLPRVVLALTVLPGLIGAALALRVRGITPMGAGSSVKVLVVMATIATIVWHWMFEQGGGLWVLQRLSPLLALLFFSVALPFATSMAAIASARDGTDVLPRVRRLVLTLAAIPLIYVLVYRSGWWPSQISEHAMTMTFVRNRPAFDRIGAAIEARSDEACRAGCPVPMAADAPIGRGYEQAEMFFYPYWTVGPYREALVKGYVYATKHVPVPLVDNFDAVTSNGRQYKHLSGNWYLYAED